MSFTESLEELIARNENGLLGKADRWERVKLGDVATIVNGFPFPSTKFTRQTGVPLLRIRDVLGDSTEAFFDGPVENVYMIEAGDLVVGMDGDFNSALWRGPRAALNQRVCKITPDGRLYSLRFLAYVLPGYLGAINAATSSITVKHLSSRTVADIPLPLPPRLEQDRLVATIEEHLSRVDAGVVGLERVQAQLPRYRAAVLKAACEGRLVPTEAELVRAQGLSYTPADALLPEGRPKDAGDPGSPRFKGLPEGWVWSNLAELKMFSLYGPRFSSDDYSDDGAYVLRTSDINEAGRVNLETAPRIRLSSGDLERYRLKAGDLLITRTGSLGTLSIYTDDVDAIAGAYLIQYRLRVPVEVGRYLFLFLRSPEGQGQLRRGGAGVGRPNLNAPTIEAIPIPLPPLQEEVRILDEVDRRLSLADALDRTVEGVLARAQRLRQAILKSAFEGKLAAQDPSDEPADKLRERIGARRSVASGSSRRLPRTKSKLST